VRITEWHSIRWLSLQKAVATIIEIYGPLVATLENEAVNNSVAKGIPTVKFVLISAVIVSNPKVDVDEMKKERKEFQRVKLQITSAAEAEDSNLKISYLDTTTENSENRFPSEDTGVLSKFEILNPCTCDQ
jgi:hypothetical protein